MLYLRFYEVSEIINKPPDYEAPELALAATFGSAPDADVPDRGTWQRG